MAQQIGVLTVMPISQMIVSFNPSCSIPIQLLPAHVGIQMEFQTPGFILVQPKPLRLFEVS